MDLTHNSEITTWLWDALTKGGVLLAVAGLATALLGKRSAATRHFLWLAALLAVVAIPVFSQRLLWSTPAQPVREYSQSLFDKFSLTMLLPTEPVATSVAPKEVAQAAATSSTIVKNPSRYSLSWPQLIAAIWAVGVFFLATRLLVGYWTLRRLARTATPTTGADWQDLQNKVEADLHIQRRVKILLSNKPVMPMTWGGWRPIVLLPAEAQNWTSLRRELVLQHELAHVKRYDWATHTLAGIIAIVYWFQPLVWFASHRMRVEREQACDDLVLQSGAPASDYAYHLLEIAQEFSTMGGPALRMAKAGGLEQRLKAILATGRVRDQLKPLIMVVTVVAVIAGTFLVSGCRKRESKIPNEIKQFCSAKELQTRALVGDKIVPTNL